MHVITSLVNQIRYRRLLPQTLPHIIVIMQLGDGRGASENEDRGRVGERETPHLDKNMAMFRNFRLRQLATFHFAAMILQVTISPYS